jgi:hypothetical protein
MKKCEKCGKNINKEDFSKFKYKQSLIGHFTDEMDPFNELTICPECIDSKENKENKENNFSNEEDNMKDSIKKEKGTKPSISKNSR